MGGGGWVFLAIFIGLAIISAISHALKNQQQAEAPRRRPVRERNARWEEVERTEPSDSFMAEIERLRAKTQRAASKPVPVVKPKPKPQVKAKPPKPRQPYVPKLEELPVATVVGELPAASSSPISTTPPSTVPEIARVADVLKPAAAGAASAAKMASSGKTMGGTTPKATPFSKSLLALLKSREAIPVAVVLHEILGPPKSRRGIRG